MKPPNTSPRRGNFIWRAIGLPYNIGPQFAFYGYIPDGSPKQHIGIVLNVKDGAVKYCYCTSKYKLLHSETDFIHIAKEKMSAYFDNPQDTYIFISPQHIIGILLITLVSRIDSGEYDICEPASNDIYIAILSRIRNSDNLSERFKREIFEFLE
jgi:hypothetical protein